MVAFFPDVDGGYTILPYIFCPDEQVRRRSKGGSSDFRSWVNDGHVIVTHGNTVNYNIIAEKIIDICTNFVVEEVVYDRWGATMLINKLIDDGVHCIPVNQDAVTLSMSMDEFQRVLNAGTLRHDGNPALRWCATNVIVQGGENSLGRLSKRRSRDRIDPIVAVLVALARFTSDPKY